MGSLYQWEAQPEEKRWASSGEGRWGSPVLMGHQLEVLAGLQEQELLCQAYSWWRRA